MKKLSEFLKESYLELQKIQWPSRQETMRLTAIVIGVSLGVGLLVAALDYVFKEALNLLIQ